MYWLAGAGASTVVACYDPVANTVTGFAGVTIYWPTVTTNGTLMYKVAGYSDGSMVIKSYNPATNTWSTLGGGPAQRAYMYAGYMSGYLYVASGMWNTFTTGYNGAWRYSLATNTYTAITNSPLALAAGASTSFDGDFHVMGGGLALTPSVASNLHYYYSEGTSTWIQSDSLLNRFGRPLGEGAYATWSKASPSVFLAGAIDGNGNVIPLLQQYQDAPEIVLIDPQVGPVGSTVVISGQNFNSASSVTIGGVSASFTVINDETINATVPPGNGKGFIQVTTLFGIATSANTFFTTGDVPTNVAPDRVMLRNATVMIDLGDGLGLQDVGLVGNVVVTLEPINVIGPLGDLTVGYKVVFDFKRHQTAPADSVSSLALANKEIVAIEFRADTDKLSFANITVNPDCDYDFSGADSMARLTGWQKMSVAQARSVFQTLN